MIIMPIKKKPFENYTLDEDKDKSREVFSISINKQERAWLDEIKEDLNIKQDGKALKYSAFIGRKVLHSLLGRKFLGYLFKKERVKFVD